MKFRSLILATAAFCAASHVFGQAPTAAWPEPTRDAKPWSRWWWFGNIADEKSLSSEMEKYAAAGLGGLELTCIYGVHGYEDRFVNFLSPAWIQNFKHTLSEAHRLGLGIDMSNGTGWPFGGPWLSETDVAHNLLHKTYTIAPGARLSEAITCMQEPLLNFTRPRSSTLADLKQPVTANPNLQELAIDQVRFSRSVPLVALMAYPEKGSPLDLTNKTAADGTLNWTAPSDQGVWTLYALFQGQHGKMVERAAPGAEGFALDHLSAEALKHYLAKFDEAFKGCDTSNLRSFFNDSYEVDDSKGESDFTPRFLSEFQNRRGYDLRLHLPELLSSSESDASSRVLSDYRETVSDLLLEGFTKPWAAWAHARGSLIRNQAHNSPANILDLYAASDIPEQEGTDILGIKMASSVAHITGKPLASAEAATWLNEHFLSTLADLKSSVDTYLLGGINHIIYHGTAFSPPDDPWPGFQFYASVELNPQNPFWKDFAAVNGYVTRALSFLQSGYPDEDVLLYYNIHDRWAKHGNGAMPHFGHGREPLGVGASSAAQELRRMGAGFDYVSDKLLQGVAFKDKELVSGKARYAVIIVPETRLMPEATLAKLVALASQGATVLVEKQLPLDTPGLHAKSESFAALLAQIRAKATIEGGITTAPVGLGRFLISDKLSSLIAHQSSIRREALVLPGLQFIRRRTDQGFLYFIVNRGSKPIDRWVPLCVSGSSAALYDPMTGRLGLAALSTSEDGYANVYLQLSPGESCIVEVRTQGLLSGPKWSYWKPGGEAAQLNGEWSIKFVSGGPALPSAIKTNGLKSWTELGGEETKSFSGTANTSISFARPKGSAPAWQLDLGEVADSARVTLNGKELGVLVQAPWRVIIPAEALGESNRLEIAVTNLAANRIADLDRRGVPWRKFYNTNMPSKLRENMGPDGLFSAAKWKPRNSGLLGPVMLTPLQTIDPSFPPK